MSRLPPVLAPTALLVAVLAAASCAKAPPPGPKIDPAIAGFIPPDTVLLVGARLEAIEKTPISQKYPVQRSIPQLDQFAAATGINPAKDLWELLYASNGQRGAVIGHGMFSDEGEPKLQKRGDNRFGYKGLTIVGSDTNGILLVNQTVLAMGDTDQLKAMVDAHEKSAGPPPAMAALLARMPATAQVWAAYGGGPLKLPIDTIANLSNINKILGMIKTGTLYLDFSTGLTGLAEGTAGSDQQGEQLESGLRAMIGFGRLSISPKQPDLQRVFDGLRPTRENREVKLHIDEPEELVDKLVTLLGGGAGGVK
jgi:hypothetical protein